MKTIKFYLNQTKDNIENLEKKIENLKIKKRVIELFHMGKKIRFYYEESPDSLIILDQENFDIIMNEFNEIKFFAKCKSFKPYENGKEAIDILDKKVINVKVHNDIVYKIESIGNRFVRLHGYIKLNEYSTIYISYKDLKKDFRYVDDENSIIGKVTEEWREIKG
jgi:hypothetical protein